MKNKSFIILTVVTIIYVSVNTLNPGANVFFDNGVSVNSVQKKELVPCGRTVGIKLYSDGLICVGFSNIGDKCPALEAGIKEGDLIVDVNGVKIKNNDTLKNEIDNSTGTIMLKLERDGKEESLKLTPIISSDGSKKVGMWVRDSVAGVGTLTFYDPTTNTFALLGHPVSDIDTGMSFSVRDGEITNCEIAAIVKGEKGIPGEIRGRFVEGDNPIGKLIENNKSGLFASTADLSFVKGKALPIALKNEITAGEAYIMSDVSGSVCNYSVTVQKVYHNSYGSARDMLIKITDEGLINQTGGIIQGMSGCPIIQNGKIIGALTHVFVNDPKRGYGVFIENMLGNTNSK